MRLLSLVVSAEKPISTFHFIAMVQATVISGASDFIIGTCFSNVICVKLVVKQPGVKCLACNSKARVCYLGCLLSKTRVVVSKVSQRVCEMLSRICIVIASVAI